MTVTAARLFIHLDELQVYLKAAASDGTDRAIPSVLRAAVDGRAHPRRRVLLIGSIVNPMFTGAAFPVRSTADAVAAFAGSMEKKERNKKSAREHPADGRLALLRCSNLKSNAWPELRCR
jgi:hypothetical protein